MSECVPREVFARIIWGETARFELRDRHYPEPYWIAVTRDSELGAWRLTDASDRDDRVFDTFLAAARAAFTLISGDADEPE